MIRGRFFRCMRYLICIDNAIINLNIGNGGNDDDDYL